MSIKIEDKEKKEPSEKLMSLINELVDAGVKFTEMIGKVWEQGAKEGFSMQEIADIIRPIARQKGLNKNQVYYLTHMPELQDRSKLQYEQLKSLNIQTFDYDVDDIKENEEYKNIMHEVLGGKYENYYETIKENIREYGQYNPLIVNDEGYVLHDYRVFRACKELGIKPRIEIKTFPSEDHEKIFLVDLYLSSGLPTWQRGVLGIKYLGPALQSLEIDKHLAKLVEISPETIETFLKEGQKGLEELDEYVAKLPEVSCETFWKVGYIQKHASEEMIRQLENDEMTIDAAFNEIKKEKMKWITN